MKSVRYEEKNVEKNKQIKKKLNKILRFSLRVCNHKKCVTHYGGEQNKWKFEMKINKNHAYCGHI